MNAIEIITKQSIKAADGVIERGELLKITVRFNMHSAIEILSGILVHWYTVIIKKNNMHNILILCTLLANDTGLTT